MRLGRSRSACAPTGILSFDALRSWRGTAQAVRIGFDLLRYSMPDLNVARMLGGMMGAGPGMGWIAHFAIGTIAWGGLFALLHDKLPGGSRGVQGLTFGAGAWIQMMVAGVPMEGKGLFGMALGIMAPVMTLVLRLIFGGVLGWSYCLLTHTAFPRHTSTRARVTT